MPGVFPPQSWLWRALLKSLPLQLLSAFKVLPKLLLQVGFPGLPRVWGLLWAPQTMCPYQGSAWPEQGPHWASCGGG
jgi:hypothetical protein